MKVHPAKTQYRKFEINIPEKELRGYSPNFYIHVSVSDLFISPIGLHILLQENRWTEAGNIYISPTQTHECGNWNYGRAIPFLGTHKSKFICSAVLLAFIQRE
jgi:hypothetical protein